MESTFTVVNRSIVLPKIRTPFEIIPLGDIHADSPAHNADLFDECLAYIKQTMKTKPVYVLLMGDELDWCSWSERKSIRGSNLHESSMATLDKDSIARCKDLLKKIGFLKGHMLGCVQGNHHYSFYKDHPEYDIRAGNTSTQLIARQLDTECIGYLSYLRASISGKSCTQRVAVDIVACHGKAGGKLAGSSTNQVDDLKRIFPTADIYVMGHDHRRSAIATSALIPCCNSRSENGLDIKEKRQWLCRSGSFLKAYENGMDGYSVKALLRPNDLGMIRIELKVVERNGSLHVDSHVWS